MNLPDSDLAKAMAEGSIVSRPDLALEFETTTFELPSRQQRRSVARYKAQTAVTRTNGTPLKRKTRRQIARASARRNRR